MKKFIFTVFALILIFVGIVYSQEEEAKAYADSMRSSVVPSVGKATSEGELKKLGEIDPNSMQHFIWVDMIQKVPGTFSRAPKVALDELFPMLSRDHASTRLTSPVEVAKKILITFQKLESQTLGKSLSVFIEKFKPILEKIQPHFEQLPMMDVESAEQLLGKKLKVGLDDHTSVVDGNVPYACTAKSTQEDYQTLLKQLQNAVGEDDIEFRKTMTIIKDIALEHYSAKGLPLAQYVEKVRSYYLLILEAMRAAKEAAIRGVTLPDTPAGASSEKIKEFENELKVALKARLITDKRDLKDNFSVLRMINHLEKLSENNRELRNLIAKNSKECEDREAELEAMKQARMAKLNTPVAATDKYSILSNNIVVEEFAF